MLYEIKFINVTVFSEQILLTQWECDIPYKAPSKSFQQAKYTILRRLLLTLSEIGETIVRRLLLTLLEIGETTLSDRKVNSS